MITIAITATRDHTYDVPESSSQHNNNGNNSTSSCANDNSCAVLLLAFLSCYAVHNIAQQHLH